LGIAALEDKIVQQAVVRVLNEIYEEDFRGFSYGFRPGRSQHMALDALYVTIKRKKVNWILDLDLKSFFDNISREKLMELLGYRIADPRILRLIQKWLKAGVIEEGVWSQTEAGTPQGAVVSPRTQKITSSLNGGCSSGGSRVRIDVCRNRLYVYDRCRAPTTPRRPSASIVHGFCFGKSINFPMRSSDWHESVPFRRVKPTATWNTRST
jgi:retron-type reverse transcriptase